MRKIVLRDNATPIYGFLSFISDRQSQKETKTSKKILDCGAGGPVPPLVLFQQHGFEGWGIDTSEEQLERARVFCQKQDINLHLQKGDMRRVPFEDETFEYVYEHYSMCHLSKKDTALAVNEMYRVLKRHGLCFLGVISMDSQPKSFYGQEREPGDYWTTEEGDELTLHSMFTDQEADELVSRWEVLSKEKRVRYHRDVAMDMSMEEWMKLYEEFKDRYSHADWQKRYKNRINAIQYSHLYFILMKP